MSDHTFKTNFTDLPEEGRLQQESYESHANVRNVVFVLSNGNEVMRNYAYLVGVDLLKDGEKNLLQVSFTSDTILLEGYRLWLLRDLFFYHIPQIILGNNSRYIADSEWDFWISTISVAT